MKSLLRASSLPFVLFLVSCGGGDGQSTDLSVCSPTLYQPNYAGATDVDLRRWESLPVRVYFKTSGTTQAGTNLENLVRQGFNQWNNELGFSLWTEVTNPSAANVTVELLPRDINNPNVLGFARVFTPSNQPTKIVQVEIVVHYWNALPLDGYDGTAAHELGHGLGIGGHSPDSNDLMFFTGNLSDRLTTSDLNTLRTAYCDFGRSAKTIQLQKSTDGTPLVCHTIVCEK